MTKLFKRVILNDGWKKVTLKKYNDFYLMAVKADKASRRDTLNKDCVRKIRFEVAVDSGRKGKYMTVNYITLNFNNLSSSLPSLFSLPIHTAL